MSATDADLLDIARRRIRDLEDQLKRARPDQGNDWKRIVKLERRASMLLDGLIQTQRKLSMNRTWAGVKGWRFGGLSASMQESICAYITGVLAKHDSSSN